MYYCSARYEEVAHLNVNDLVFTKSFNVLITFGKAKNNQYGNALINCISKLDNEFCPYVMLQIYIENSQKSEEPLFPNLNNKGRSIIKGSRISGDNGRKVVKATLVIAVSQLS